ncbi:MAG TPA: segregation/condensation protein A [Acidobacteria bacterium]|nr:segregation/condensation protein A [Acidobacteriota bacterium]
MSDFENNPSFTQDDRPLEEASFKIPEGFESRFTELDSVRVRGFEGPLDLLLFLIKDQKLNILDLPIAEITQQYMEYLRLMEELNLDIAAEYIAMAAHLIQIKSKMMLPPLPGEEDLDPRKKLVQKLLEYQQVREATGHLQSLKNHWDATPMIPQANLQEFAHVEEEPIKATLFDILASYRDALSRLVPPPAVEIQTQPKTVEERIGEVLEMLQDGSWKTLMGLFFDVATREEIVLTFVAILELARTNKVSIVQSEPFGEIRVKAA